MPSSFAFLLFHPSHPPPPGCSWAQVRGLDNEIGQPLVVSLREERGGEISKGKRPLTADPDEICPSGQGLV